MTDLSAPRSFRIGVKTPGDRDWSSNMRRFATFDEARVYGARLADRWTAVVDWVVLPSDDAPEAPSPCGKRWFPIVLANHGLAPEVQYECTKPAGHTDICAGAPVK